MKVLYLFRSLAIWGGIERILVDKMNWLATEGGYDVYMLTSDQGEHPIPYRLDKRVHFEDLSICFHKQYHYSAFKRFRIAFKMQKRYKKLLSSRLHQIQPNIIVCTTADQLGIITAIKEEVPLIVESHSICNRTIEHSRPALVRVFYRNFFLKSISKVDCLVALTRGDAGEWQQYHKNVKVIPNMLHPCNSRRSSLTSKHVIWVGRFDYQKRAEIAIRIWDMVVSKHPDWYLDIYGDGEQASEIQTMAMKVKNVIQHKPTSQIFDCYRDSSILMSTSLFEPFGLVIVEAMSCGVPVVAFDCPYGPADIITDGVNGFLIPFDNVRYFAEKLCLLIDDFSVLKRMGYAAFLSSNRFESRTIMAKWMALFDELTKKR